MQTLENPFSVPFTHIQNVAGQEEALNDSMMSKRII